MGRARRENWVCFHLSQESASLGLLFQITGPMPMANSWTVTPHSRAAMKWPHSWAAIKIPKRRMANRIYMVLPLCRVVLLRPPGPRDMLLFDGPEPAFSVSQRREKTRREIYADRIRRTHLTDSFSPATVLVSRTIRPAWASASAKYFSRSISPAPSGRWFFFPTPS